MVTVTLRAVATAIAALVQLLQSTNLDDSTRRLAASSLGEIIQNNQHRIALVKALI